MLLTNLLCTNITTSKLISTNISTTNLSVSNAKITNITSNNILVGELNYSYISQETNAFNTELIMRSASTNEVSITMYDNNSTGTDSFFKIGNGIENYIGEKNLAFYNSQADNVAMYIDSASDLNTRKIVPINNNSFDIGESSYRYSTLYVTNVDTTNLTLSSLVGLTNLTTTNLVATNLTLSSLVGLTNLTTTNLVATNLTTTNLVATASSLLLTSGDNTNQLQLQRNGLFKIGISEHATPNLELSGGNLIINNNKGVVATNITSTNLISYGMHLMSAGSLKFYDTNNTTNFQLSYDSGKLSTNGRIASAGLNCQTATDLRLYNSTNTTYSNLIMSSNDLIITAPNSITLTNAGSIFLQAGYLTYLSNTIPLSGDNSNDFGNDSYRWRKITSVNLKNDSGTISNLMATTSTIGNIVGSEYYTKSYLSSDIANSANAEVSGSDFGISAGFYMISVSVVGDTDRFAIGMIYYNGSKIYVSYSEAWNGITGLIQNNDNGKVRLTNNIGATKSFLWKVSCLNKTA